MRRRGEERRGDDVRRKRGGEERKCDLSFTHGCIKPPVLRARHGEAMGCACVSHPGRILLLLMNQTDASSGDSSHSAAPGGGGNPSCLLRLSLSNTPRLHLRRLRHLHHLLPACSQCVCSYAASPTTLRCLYLSSLKYMLPGCWGFNSMEIRWVLRLKG